MNTQEIYNLLDKYYRGESSDEEEMVLREYFSKEEVPPELGSEREIFDYYKSAGKIQAPSPDLEKKIIAAIDDIEKSETVFSIKRKLYAVLSFAATILLLIGSYVLFIQKPGPADTFSDPSIAYAETLKILYNVSSRMNSGMRALEPVNKMETTASKSMGTISRSAGMIGNKLKPLGYFQKAMNIVSSPMDLGNKK